MLDWPEKSAAAAAAAAGCSGRLVERREQSVAWDLTSNLFIEGDNLHAAKLLRASYAEGMKLAYLDPPYNLGRDVVYADPRADDEWLAMMFPRLLLARELLTADGVICVSIDDAELPRLRLLCDDVFGAANFVATFVWQTKRAARGVPPRNLLMHNHEYVVCYARNADQVRFRGLARDDADFANPDDDPRGPWRSESMKATGNQDNYYSIADPRTGAEFHANWAFSQSSMRTMIADGLVLFPPGTTGTPRQKKFRNTYRNSTKAAVTSLGWHSTERATKALMDLFDGEKVFSFPKPVSLLEFFCDQVLGPGDTVLDMFAGSGTTGHAVTNLNAADGGGRRFVLIQLPERLDGPDGPSGPQRAAAAYCDRLGRPRTIAELTKERLRRAGASFQVHELIHD